MKSYYRHSMVNGDVVLKLEDEKKEILDALIDMYEVDEDRPERIKDIIEKYK